MDRDGIWHGIRSASASVELTLQLPAGQKLNYFEHITLGAWNGRDFTTLKYPNLTVTAGFTFSLQPDFYRITVTARQIDGTASVAIWHFRLSGDRVLRVVPPEDQTACRLKRVPLILPEGPLRALLSKDSGRNLLLILAEPGSEPTEHLLREMLECAEGFRCAGCRILLLAESAEALDHPTVQLLKETLPAVELSSLQDSDGLAALRRQMRVGDLRLPFVICADSCNRGVYADANYRIRMAQTLLEVQKLMAERSNR